MKPTSWQKAMIKALLKAERPVVLAGSIRSGKTLGAAMAFALHSTTVREANYIIGAKTYTTALRNVVAPLMQVAKAWGLPHRLLRSEQKLRLCGNNFLVFGAGNEASQDAIQGMTAHGFLLDELPLLAKSFLMQAIGRCSVERPLMAATLNKTNPNHWVKSELIDSGEVQVVESTLDDNPHIAKVVKERYARLLTGHYGARMLDNEWAAATGRVWPDLREVDVGVPSQGGVVSMDAAQSGVTAALRFVQQDGRWVIANEYYYLGERPFSTHAAQIAGWKPSLVIVDPSSPGLIAAVRRLGFDCIGASNKVLPGLHSTEVAIRSQRVVLRRGAAPGLLKEMQSYVWDEKAALIGEDKPVKIADHSCDALRYFCMAKLPMQSLLPTAKGAGL